MSPTIKQVDVQVQRRLADLYKGHTNRVSNSSVIPSGGSRTEESVQCVSTAISTSSPALWRWRKYTVFPGRRGGGQDIKSSCAVKKAMPR